MPLNIARAGLRAAPFAAALLLPLLLLSARPAAAQYGAPGGGMGGMSGMGGMGGMGRMPGGGRSEPPRAVAPPPPRLTADIRPRLEAGALLCRTVEDLRRRVAMQAGGGAAPGPVPNCRAISGMLPVTILGRAGPGATQVQTVAPQPETGWTDAWLPERAAPAAPTPAVAPPGASPGRRAP